jgi:esterase
MATGKVPVGDIEIWWEEFGDRDAESVLLVMGATAQATAWPPYFYGPLVDAGYHVLRFDNRDIGLSTWVDYSTQPYTIGDMAADAVGLLDALDIESAHWIGASMGGMISQQAAIDSPQRVRSLTSIMSSPSSPMDPELPSMTAELTEVMRQAASMDLVEAAVELYRALSGPRFGFDENAFRAQLVASAGRGGINSACAHALAVEGSPSRREALGSVEAPALVLHGSADPILPLEHGRATAEAIPGARLVIAEGFGHDLPAAAIDEYLDPILEHLKAAR